MCNFVCYLCGTSNQNVCTGVLISALSILLCLVVLFRRLDIKCFHVGVCKRTVVALQTWEWGSQGYVHLSVNSKLCRSRRVISVWTVSLTPANLFDGVVIAHCCDL